MRDYIEVVGSGVARATPDLLVVHLARGRQSGSVPIEAGSSTVSVSLEVRFALT